MGCNGLLSALEGGWADAAHGPLSTSHHFYPDNLRHFWWEVIAHININIITVSDF
jgi:hypothetical protein